MAKDWKNILTKANQAIDTFNSLVEGKFWCAALEWLNNEEAKGPIVAYYGQDYWDSLCNQLEDAAENN